MTWVSPKTAPPAPAGVLSETGLQFVASPGSLQASFIRDAVPKAMLVCVGPPTPLHGNTYIRDRFVDKETAAFCYQTVIKPGVAEVEVSVGESMVYLLARSEGESRY